jgi:hypothetical protein
VFAVAAYGVPSEFGEDEVMIAVVPGRGASEPRAIAEFLGPRGPPEAVRSPQGPISCARVRG